MFQTYFVEPGLQPHELDLMAYVDTAPVAACLDSLGRDRDYRSCADSLGREPTVGEQPCAYRPEEWNPVDEARRQRHAQCVRPADIAGGEDLLHHLRLSALHEARRPFAPSLDSRQISCSESASLTRGPTLLEVATAS